MRRVSTRVFAASAASAKRFLTPSEDLKKLYESDFEKQKYPADVVPTDSSVFAQFLWKAAEPKNQTDAIQKDLETVTAAAKNMPVFWERTIDVEKQPELKGLNPATIFTMKWMQVNGMLGNIDAVRATFDTFANAKKNRIVAKIYLPGPAKDHAAALKEAQDVAKKIQAENPKFAKHNLDFETVVESDFASGFAVEVCDKYYANAKGKGDAAGSAAAKETDYTALPAQQQVKTEWDENIETEILRKYVDQMSKYDLEEQANGV